MSRKGTSDAVNIGYIETVDMTAGYVGKLPVNVKNNSTETVVLSVHMADAPSGVYVETSFYPGWNPEIVDEIQANAEIEAIIQIGM